MNDNASIQKAFDDGLEAVVREVLAPAFARLLLDADDVAKGSHVVAELLAEFKTLTGDSSDTLKILDVAFNTRKGRRLARDIARLTRPDNAMNKGAETVGARARLALSPTVRLEKARGGAGWGATWRAEVAERLRQLVLKDLLADQHQTRATFHKSSEGRALYDLVHAPAAELLFDDAVDRLEEIAPGWIVEKLEALGGNIKKADTAIGKLEVKAVAIQKADPKMTIEAARAEAWKRNPGLYREQRKERARARAAQ